MKLYEAKGIKLAEELLNFGWKIESTYTTPSGVVYIMSSDFDDGNCCPRCGASADLIKDQGDGSYITQRCKACGLSSTKTNGNTALIVRGKVQHYDISYSLNSPSLRHFVLIK